MRTSISIIFTLFSLLACKEELPTVPKGYLDMDFQRIYFPGESIAFKGIFKDVNEILSIRLTNKYLDINEYIDLSASRTTLYDLKFTYNLSSDLIPGKYNVEIAVTNKLGGTKNFDYQVDFAKLPSASDMQLYYQGYPGSMFRLQGKIFDEQGLSQYKMTCPALDLIIIKQFGPGERSYQLNESFEIYSHIPKGLYTMSFAVTNTRQLTYQFAGMLEVLE